ncbi:MAG TPA: tricarballylate utilization 4Fe-4S protein TcuB [Bryobacteraceae bacterium]
MPPVEEGRRILTICNACRYCEGFCAVFPAIESRPQFSGADLDYLANLCHNCGECYYACQYAPPHAFAVNVPQVLAQVRLDSYRRYARPRWFARFYRNSGELAIATAALAFVAGLALSPVGGTTFYDIVPHSVMVGIFGVAALLILAALLVSTAGQFAGIPKLNRPALARAARSMLTLKYLGSGGAGCTYPGEHHSMARRWFHHFTFYGFLLCFASTCVAAWNHFALKRIAPYPYLSLPVVLGILGGAGLLAGPAGLYLLKRQRASALADTRQDALDLTFLALLFATSLTGLLLLLLRQSVWMRPLLLIHLATVLALFATLPYGKFVHGIYRAAALLRYAIEKK